MLQHLHIRFFFLSLNMNMKCWREEMRRNRVQVMFNHKETNVQSSARSACVSPRGVGNWGKVCLLRMRRRGSVVPSVAEDRINEGASKEWKESVNSQTHEMRAGACCEPYDERINALVCTIWTVGTENKCTRHARRNLIKKECLESSCMHTHGWLFPSK